MAEFVPAYTFHKRLHGPDNAFRYSVDFVLFEPEAAERLPFPLRRNAPGLMALRDRDHGGARGAGRGAAWVRGMLAARGLDALRTARVRLLTQPRMFGYLFNPVSFWLIEQDGLRAVIAEVNNTMGDRHSYLCHHADLRAISAGDTLVADKLMHVSPFQDVGGQYAFRFDLAEGHIGIRIDFRIGNGGMVATLAGERRPLTSRALLGSMIRRPLGSLRGWLLIHWQAVRLALKRAKFHSRPTPPADEISGGAS